MGERKMSADSIVLLVTGFCFLFFLQHTQQQTQPLQSGDRCEGEQKYFCWNNTKCERYGSGVLQRYVCVHRFPPGHRCHHGPFHLCQKGHFCDRRTHICVIGWGADCANNRDKCYKFYSCDATNVCRFKVNGWCSKNESCGVGAWCVGRKCKCDKRLFELKNKTCVPLHGTTGGPCSKQRHCKDPYGRCNKKIGLCVCKPPTVPSSRDFTCKFDAGQACNSSQQCRPETICDTDNICRLIAGEKCDGDKATLCQLGDLCIEGVCRNKIGDPCAKMFDKSICEPPSVCWTHMNCSYRRNMECSAHPDSCESGKQVMCDTVTRLCKVKIDSPCYVEIFCPYGSTCVNKTCKCQPDGRGVWNTTTQACEIPEGFAGGVCRTGKKVKPCDDPSAKCKDGKCECELGYVAHPNFLNCSVNWRTCSLTGQGKVNTFSQQETEVRLPCTFRLAKIRCGRAKVFVHASNSYESTIHNTLITALNVTIIDKIDGVNWISTTYGITLDRIVEYQKQTGRKGSAWETVSSDAVCSDSDVILTTNVSSGVSVLQRKLLKVTYTPPVVTRLDTGNYSVDNWGLVLTQCAHPVFDGLQKYPYALCGKLEDDGLNVYQSRVERKLAKNISDNYGYLFSDATEPARVTDRAILLKQKNVIQSNPLCKEAADVVMDRECPALQEKLYNCSHMYDVNNPSYFIYADCVDTIFEDPMQVFVSCLRAQCGRLEGDNKNTTCQTLQIASDGCDDKRGVNSPTYPWFTSIKIMAISDLLALANCTVS